MSVVAYTALIAVFATSSEREWFSYVAFLLSAYALAIDIACLPELVPRMKRTYRSLMASCWAVRLIRKSQIGRRFLDDPGFRQLATLAVSTLYGIAYAAFSGFVGIAFLSAWFISVSVYYLLLAAIRAYIFISFRKELPDALAWARAKTVAYLLLALDVPMSGMCIMMVVQDTSYNYPEYVIYLLALYTFTSVVASSFGLIKSKRTDDALCASTRTVSAVSALMSVLVLQTSMISHFSTDGEGYRMLMNSITGAFVITLSACLGLTLALHSNKKLKGKH